MAGEDCNDGTVSNDVKSSFTTLVTGENLTPTNAEEPTKAESDIIGREAVAHDDARHAGHPEAKEATTEGDRNDVIASFDIESGSTQVFVEDMISMKAASYPSGSPDISENTPNIASFLFARNDVVAIAPHDASESTPPKRRRRTLQEKLSSPRRHPLNCFYVDCYMRRKDDLPIACQLRVQWWRNGKMKEIKGKGGTQKHSVMLSTSSAKRMLCTKGLSNNLNLDCSDVKQVHAKEVDSSKAIVVFETQYMAFHLTISGADPVELGRLIADVREYSECSS